MWLDIMSQYNTLQVNIKLANLLGLEVATYWAALMDVYARVVNKFKDEFTFESLNKIYQKLIEIYSKIDDDNFKVYNEKLKKLLIEYDNLLTGKSN